MRNFADDVLPPELKQPGELKEARGLIVARLGLMPRVYRVNITFTPVVTLIYDQLNAVAGDPSNPANLFVRYYYPRCNKTIAGLLKLGIHTVRLARALNSAAIGEADAWICKAGEFRQLGIDEVSHYERFSQSLDANILKLLDI